MFCIKYSLVFIVATISEGCARFVVVYKALRYHIIFLLYKL